MTDFLGEVVFAAIILGIWTIFYRENAVYKTISSMSVGLMLAFWLKGGFDTIYKDVFVPASQMNPARVAVLIIGLLMFLRFYPSLSFVSKWPIAILAGVGTAIASKGAVSAMILSQITAGPFLTSDIYTNINNVIIWVGIVATTVYFLFSFRRGPVLNAVSKVGQVYMMLAFGVVFGQSIYSASVLTQMNFLLKDPGYYVTAVAILIVAADAVMRMRKQKPVEAAAG
jgi:hypothetical protein